MQKIIFQALEIIQELPETLLIFGVHLGREAQQHSSMLIILHLVGRRYRD